MGQKTVVTFGTFDLLHVGHIRILNRAAQHGDKLLVGVSTDSLNFEKKGRYPIIPEEERKELIGSLSVVDGVFDESSLEDKRQYLIDHGAHVLVMGDDWQGKFDHLSDIVEIVYLPRTHTVSTTWLEAYIRKRTPGERRSAVS